MKLHTVVLLVVAAAVPAGTAKASTIFLSTTSTFPALINPTYTMYQSPGNTAKLYVFWEPTPEQIGTDPYTGDPVFENEQLSGWGHNIVDDNAILSTTMYQFLNPTAAGQPRWGSTNAGTSGGTFLVNAANPQKVGGSNLGFFTGSAQGYFNVSGHDVWRLATLTFQATTYGTSHIRLQVGPDGISFENPPNPRPINFGFGDAAAQSTTYGSGTALADATVIVVPEPGTLALLGIGLVAWLAVRRRCRAP